MFNEPILIVDDDKVFLRMLQKTLSLQNIQSHTACTTEEALKLMQQFHFEYAVLDLNLDGQSGLALMQNLLIIQPKCKILILTGYASIATAVEAIKLGAIDYLCKPAASGEIIQTFLKHSQNQKDKLTSEEKNIGNSLQPIENTQPLATKPTSALNFTTMSPKRLEWEHIQRILQENDGNISATATALKMHRRTLQRKLQKKPSAH